MAAAARWLEAEFAALHEEIKSLRDTAMQYDLSFDTALQGLERRLTTVERQTYTQSDERQSVGSRV